MKDSEKGLNLSGKIGKVAFDLSPHQLSPHLRQKKEFDYILGA